MSFTSKFDDDRSVLKPIDPLQMNTWKFLFQVHLDAKGCGKALSNAKPVASVERLRPLLGRRGAETRASKAYLKRVRKAAKEWRKADKRAYAYLVKACEPNESAMEIVLKDSNSKVTAAQLMEKLADQISLIWSGSCRPSYQSSTRWRLILGRRRRRSSSIGFCRRDASYMDLDVLT